MALQHPPVDDRHVAGRLATRHRGRTLNGEAIGRGLARWVLAAFMGIAGLGHFVAADSFLGQVPTWLPARTTIVLVSGVVEIAFALALMLLPAIRCQVGWALAAFFVLVFPGNLYQAIAGTDAFGLDTPAARWARLVAQPILILWALWSTGAWPRHDPPVTAPAR